MTQNLQSLKDWIGKSEWSVDHVTIPLVHRLAATLDRDDPMPKHGDVLPYGWHLMLFPRVARHSPIACSWRAVAAIAVCARAWPTSSERAGASRCAYVAPRWSERSVERSLEAYAETGTRSSDPLPDTSRPFLESAV